MDVAASQALPQYVDGSIPIMFLESLARVELQKCLSVTEQLHAEVLSSGRGLSTTCRCAGRLRKQFGVTCDIFFGKMLYHMGIPPHPAVNMQLHSEMLTGYVLTCRKL